MKTESDLFLILKKLRPKNERKISKFLFVYACIRVQPSRVLTDRREVWHVICNLNRCIKILAPPRLRCMSVQLIGIAAKLDAKLELRRKLEN